MTPNPPQEQPPGSPEKAHSEWVFSSLDMLYTRIRIHVVADFYAARGNCRLTLAFSRVHVQAPHLGVGNNKIKFIVGWLVGTGGTERLAGRRCSSGVVLVCSSSVGRRLHNTTPLLLLYAKDDVWPEARRMKKKIARRARDMQYIKCLHHHPYHGQPTHILPLCHCCVCAERKKEDTIVASCRNARVPQQHTISDGVVQMYECM